MKKPILIILGVIFTLIGLAVNKAPSATESTHDIGSFLFITGGALFIFGISTKKS